MHGIVLELEKQVAAAEAAIRKLPEEAHGVVQARLERLRHEVHHFKVEVESWKTPTG